MSQYRRVTVRFQKEIIIDWECPMFGSLTLRYVGDRMVVVRDSLLGGQETYTTSAEESVYTEG